MTYERKTKDIYIIYRYGEEIDSADTLNEARRLKKEHFLAFHGGNFSIIKKRVKK